MSVVPPSIRVAKDFYDVIFNPETEILVLASTDELDPECANEARAASIIVIMKRLPLESYSLRENEHNFVRVAGMRGPQLKQAIREFDIISKYCHPNDCEEQRLKVESVLTKTLLEINKDNLIFINRSSLIKEKPHGGKKREQDRINRFMMNFMN